jgi:hypothetical protein
MLIIGILITADSCAAIPHSTVVKEDVLTYPAGHYLSDDPLLLSLKNYEDGNRTTVTEHKNQITFLK